MTLRRPSSKEPRSVVFKTTKYAEEMLHYEGMDWPERVKVLHALDRKIRGRQSQVR